MLGPNHTYWAYIPNLPFNKGVIWADIVIHILVNEFSCLPGPYNHRGPAKPEEEGVMMKMKTKNITHVSEFYLLRISDDPELQPILYGLFLSMYLISVLGNLLIILTVSSDSHLHTPMYFFLSILSLADIGFISTIVPNMVADLQIHSPAISYVGCLTQMSLFVFFACMDNMLLTVMAYDRICGIMAVSFTVKKIISSLMKSTGKWMELENIILSEVTQTQKDKHGILFSYYKIISSIQRVSSTSGKYKAFSTCGSHLSVVCLFYGTAIGVYVGSTVSNFPENCAVASLMYTVVTPMLNPFIYSLRNKDIESALWKLWKRKK
ncbi:hypothetical protein STEG23_016292 [Scotinomys teguina]